MDPPSPPYWGDARQVGRDVRLGAEGQRGIPASLKAGLGAPQGTPPSQFRACHNRALPDLQAAGGMHSSGQLPSLPPLPSGSRRPLPFPHGGMR